LAKNLIQELMPRCEGCGKPSPSFLCTSCLSIERSKSSFYFGPVLRNSWDQAHISFDYDSKVIQNWLWRIKEKSQAERLQDLKFEHLPPNMLECSYDAIVAFPGDPTRSSRRLFDVADYLGRRLAKLLGQNFFSGAFVRRAFLGTLKDFGVNERRAFITKLVSLRSGFLPSGRLLLVDDVMTSGASLEWGAQLLKTRANRVDVYVLARKFISK